MHKHSWFQSSAASTGTWMQQKSLPASGWRCVKCLPAEGWTSHAHFCSNPSREAAQTASRRLTHRAIPASSPPSHGAGHTAGKSAFSSLSAFSPALGAVATGCADRSRPLVPPTRTEPQPTAARRWKQHPASQTALIWRAEAWTLGPDDSILPAQPLIKRLRRKAHSEEAGCMFNKTTMLLFNIRPWMWHYTTLCNICAVYAQGTVTVSCTICPIGLSRKITGHYVKAILIHV